MKKRFETILIFLCMMITLMPFTALAVNDGTIYVGGVELTSTADTPAYALTDESGKVTTAGAGAENYNIKWDGNILTLSDAKITQESYVFLDSTSAAAIYCKNDIEIYLKGTNTVTSLAGNPENGIHMSSGIYSEGNISISGDGVLEVSGGDVDFDKDIESARAESYGIYSYNGSVTISSGKVTAAGGEAISQSDYARSSGIYSKGLVITGGEITANNNSYSHGNGAASYSYGICSKSNVIIENAKIYAEGSFATYSAGIFVEGNITIESGNVQALGGRSDSATSSGIAAVNGGSVTINGGKVIAAIGLTENGDANAIYADGNITINGGKVAATGPSNNVDGVEPQYSRGIFSGTGDITITGKDTVVITKGGFAKKERDAIMANAGDIIILGGNVRADGSLSSYDGFGNGLRALIRKEWPPAPHRSQDKAGSTGGNIIISGGNLAAVGDTKSLNYEGELIVRPKNTEITVSVLDNWITKEDPWWQLDWEGMATSATQIEGSPFTKETVIDKTLTENKLYFGATSVDVDPIDPGDETIPDDQNDQEDQINPNNQTEDMDKDNYSPKTGDEGNSTVWLALMLASVLSMVASEQHDRRKRRVK